MAQVLLKASAYVFVIALGYILKRLRFFKPDDYKLILKITLNITMPAAVITNFAAFEFDFSLLFAVLLALGSNVLLWGLGYLFSMKKGRDVRVLYTINFPGYNIGAFTMPFVQGFLGPVGVVTTCLFDAGNAIMCTGGSYALTSRAAGAEGAEKPTFKRSIRKAVYHAVLHLYADAADGDCGHCDSLLDSAHHQHHRQRERFYGDADGGHDV